jgi:hypothetical protein
MAVVRGGPSIWIGFDPREAAAFAVARHSLRRDMSQSIPIYGLILADLQQAGIYCRPTQIKLNGEGRVEMVDVLSVRPDYDGRMSTQHAIARFLVPYLAKTDWALFMDADMLVRSNVVRLFEQLDRRYAVYCVKHDHAPLETVKMDGQVQTRYPRKNWSSFLVFNCDHPSNRRLTPDLVNAVPGRDLHAFCWLDDHEIGELGPEWNFLVGHTDSSVAAKVAHFTSGTPDIAGYERVAFAPEWHDALHDWARGCDRVRAR